MKRAPALEPSRLLTPREAAGRLGVHPDTLARWADAGSPAEIKRACVRMPKGHRRYIEARIEAYIRSLAAA